MNNTFADDDENGLVNILRGSGVKTTYAYATDGLRRFSHETGANPVTFLWNNDDLLDEITSGAITTKFAVLEGEVIAERRDGTRRLAACPEPSRRVPGPLGSTAALLDNTQTKVAETEFWPYGETRASAGSPSPLGYVGTWGYYAAVANLSYVRARYLNRALGRWITEDPIGFGGGDAGPYTYGHDRTACLGHSSSGRAGGRNPVLQTTPLGMSPDDVDRLCHMVLVVVIATEECVLGPFAMKLWRWKCAGCRDTGPESNRRRCKRACGSRRGKGGIRCRMLACIEAGFYLLGRPMQEVRECLCICPTGRCGPMQEWQPDDF